MDRLTSLKGTFLLLLVLSCSNENSPLSKQEFTGSNPTQLPVQDSSPLPSKPLGDYDSRPDETPALPELNPDSGLKQSSKLCSDNNFGKNGLEACFLGETSNISIFQALKMQFAIKIGEDSLVRSSIEENLKLVDVHGKKVDGNLTWMSERELKFQPTAPLANNTSYRWLLEQNLEMENRPRSRKGKIVLPFRFELSTRAKFDLELAINGVDLESENFFDIREHPHLELGLSITNSELIQNLGIRKLSGEQSLRLCEDSCDKNYKIDLKKISPTVGMNSYILYWDTAWGSTQKTSFSFIWGKLEKSLPTDSLAKVSLKRASQVINETLSSYVSGDFSLETRSDNAEFFNDLLNKDAFEYPRNLPRNCLNRAEFSFPYLANLGPYCDLNIEGAAKIGGGFLGQANYQARADIFVNRFEVVSEAENAKVALKAKDGFSSLDLNIGKFRGLISVVLEVKSARYAGLPVPGTKGFYLFEIPFTLNTNGSSASAYIDLDLEEEAIKLKIRGYESFDPYSSINGDANSKEYFNLKEWNDRLNVGSPSQLDPNEGLWALIVNAILKQAVQDKIPELKPRIVFGISSDIIQRVAAEPLNILKSQLEGGLELPFPFFLPPPYNEFEAKLKAAIDRPLEFGSKRIQAEARADIELKEHPSLQARKLSKTQGYPLLVAGESLSPDEIAEADLMASDADLLSIDINFVNHLLFKLWSQGVFELSLNKAFTEYIDSFAKFDPDQKARGKEIWFIRFIPKLLGRDIEELEAVTEDGNVIKMNAKDEVYLKLNMQLPPVAKLIEYQDQAAIAISAGSVNLSIYGKNEQQEYLIASVNLAIESLASLGFTKYSNPFELDFFNSTPALSIQVISDADKLDYAITADAENNPFGLDIYSLQEALGSLVDELFIPLVNDGLRELPLPGLKACGISLEAEDMKLHSYPNMIERQHLLIQLALSNYFFDKTCRLEADFVPPVDYKPLPPKEEPEPELPPEGEDYKFDMSFDKLPFEPGKPKALVDLPEDCRNSVFFELSCATAKVEYKKDVSGEFITDERGRKIYDYTDIKLFALVSKESYALRISDRPSIEGQFFDFASWPDYVSDAKQDVVMYTSVKMPTISLDFANYERHYVDYASNSPKASGFIPIRNVTLHRVLDKPVAGAEISTEFFANTSTFVEVPEGERALNGAFGLSFHVGNMHVVDCGKLDWCNDPSNWLVIYDSQLRPEDTSLPEDVLPYLKRALNAILAGMFPAQD